MSDEPDRATPVQRFRAPAPIWKAFKRVCERRGTTRSAALLEFIRSEIIKHGDEQDLENLAAGEQELTERRARMSPGRPPKR